MKHLLTIADSDDYLDIGKGWSLGQFVAFVQLWC